MNAVAGSALVVDDEPYMLALLREYLEPEGYAVVTAPDGAAAWALLDGASQPFDVLVTDRNMPNMSGLQLLAKMKQDERFKELPVIFQTAYASREEMAEGLRAGVYYYLAKPYDRQVMLALVGAAIEESRKRRQLRAEVAHHNQALGLLRTGEFRFRTLAEAQYLAPLLAQFSCDAGRVVSGISELLINAVEHGNLGITYAEKGMLVTEGRWSDEVARRLQLPEHCDKIVRVELQREPGQTTFIITDQGAGFDPENYLTFDPERAIDVHGRGIAMSRMLSFDSLEYHGSGNQVAATLRCPPQASPD